MRVVTTIAAAYACLAAVHSAWSAPPAPHESIQTRVARAEQYVELDRYDDAVALLIDTESLVDSGLGLRSRVDALMGRIALDRGRFFEARRLFGRSLSVASRHWTDDAVETVPARLGLGDLHLEVGNHEDAEIVYRRCLAILEPVLGAAHLLTSRAAIGLGRCLNEAGEFAGARTVLQRYLDASVAAHGSQTDAAGMLTLYLAAVQGLSGRNAESIALFRRAAGILEEVHGPDHARTALGLSGLAHVTSSMGDQDTAAEIYRRCIGIVERRHPTPNPAASNYRCRLALCLQRNDTLSVRAATMEHGIADAVALYGDESRQVALYRRQLGLILLTERRPAEAREVFLNALSILERDYGPRHPYLGPCLKGLGHACQQLGLIDEALEWADRAVAVFESSDGRDQIERAVVLSWKSHVLTTANLHDEAVATCGDACDVVLSVLDQVYRVTADGEAVTYANYSRMMSQSLLMALTAHPDPSPALVTRAFDLCSRTHGLVLDRLAERQRYLAHANEQPELARLDAEWTQASQTVTDLAVRGPTGDTAEFAEALARARSRQETAERALTIRCAELRDQLGPPGARCKPTADALAPRLGPHDELLQFIHYPRLEAAKDRKARYGAFRLQHANAGNAGPTFTDLGPSSVIDSLIVSYRASVEAVQGSRLPTAREEATYRQVARALYDCLWAPLVPATGDSTDTDGVVFLLPARSLYLVDFNGLLGPDGHLVIEQRQVHILSSGRDLLHQPPSTVGVGALVVGGPETSMEQARVGCFDPTIHATPLPGASREARSVAALIRLVADEPVTLLLGNDATEQDLKQQLPGKRLAHLATHGFYCAPAKRTSEEVDPLLNSGLVLAPSGDDDGLLTAREVCGLDLQGLDWVALSACSSGLGHLVGVDGVFGLRRAFKIAGARTVVMSLWRVSDTRMNDLMRELYRLRLTGSSTVSAVRQAQLQRLRNARLRWHRVHPSLWGGVVAEGDWR